MPSAGVARLFPGQCARYDGISSCRKTDTWALHHLRIVLGPPLGGLCLGCSLWSLLELVSPLQVEIRLPAPPPTSSSSDVPGAESAGHRPRNEPLVHGARSVPGWFAPSGGIPCCRKPDSGTRHCSGNRPLPLDVLPVRGSPPPSPTPPGRPPSRGALVGCFPAWDEPSGFLVCLGR